MNIFERLNSIDQKSRDIFGDQRVYNLLEEDFNTHILPVLGDKWSYSNIYFEKGMELLLHFVDLESRENVFIHLRPKDIDSFKKKCQLNWGQHA
ncbi:MAG: hypothetical protein AB8E15_06745 [Bdellovibrionales bacterium]